MIGHADVDSGVYPQLLEAIKLHITDYGVREFFVGCHGGFDSMALRALKEARQAYPHIRRILVLAYHPAHLSTGIPEDVDESLYPFDTPVMPRYAIVKANRKMIERCDYLIAYVRHTGKARDFAAYAQRKGKRIHYI